ncbi:hypothetical protein [Hyphococcus sp.]|jgi:hypothetical protein|uniref:hypothetical protein n=1 Tax=Hyphococcus sp. TaxID=2038636 RepID=UPI003D0EE932
MAGTPENAKPRVILWTFVFGLVLNILGWLGNNLWLGQLWDETGAAAQAAFVAPWPPLVKEVISLLSDFIYAFAMVWIFSHAKEKTVAFALKLAFVIWLAGAALVYLVMVNSGFLPLEISVKTSLLALATFLLAAPLLPAVIKN